jgi:hypothetical protein
MERMLELPVNAAAGEMAAGDRTTEPSPFAELTSSDFESYRTDEGDALAVDSARAFDFSSAASVDVPGNPATGGIYGGASTGLSSPAGNASPAAATIQSGSLVSSPGSVDDDPPAPIWLWPVVGINRVYDGIMGLLGGPGRVLLGIGRTWLGWIGLIMLAAALAWGILDWIHWAG